MTPKEPEHNQDQDGNWTDEYVHGLESRLIEKENECERLRDGTLKQHGELTYIDGIVVKGNGVKMQPNDTYRDRILGYVKSLEGKALSTVSALQTAQNELASLRSELAKQKAEVERLRNINKRLPPTQRTYESELSRQEKELATLRSENEELQVDVKATHLKCQSVELSYTRAQVQVDFLTASLAEADEAIAGLWRYGNDDWFRCHCCHTYLANQTTGEILVNHKPTCIVLKSQERQKERG